MKKIKLIIAVISIIIISTNISKAQFAVGGGLVFATPLNTLGINAKGLYTFKLKDKYEIRANLGYSYFLNNNKDFNVYKTKNSLSGVNLEFNYMVKLDMITFYPILGVNAAFTKIDTTYLPEVKKLYGNPQSTSLSKTYLGPIIGGGFQYEIQNIVPFIELKHAFGKAKESFLTLGVFYKF